MSLYPNIIALLDEPTVYWEPPVNDGTGGYNSLSSPVQITARWQYSAHGHSGPNIQRSFEGASLEERSSVWSGTEMLPDSYLWKGLLADLPGGPDLPVDAYRVASVYNVRAVKTLGYLYKAYLDAS